MIAFTIETDNESERQMADAGFRLFRISHVMWSNYLRFVDEAGVPVRELRSLAGVSSQDINARLAALQRWGYVTVEPGPADSRPTLPRGAWIVRPTLAGRKVREVCQPLAGVVEERWRARLGEDDVDRLRESLLALVNRLDIDLPHYLPVMNPGDRMLAPGPQAGAGHRRDTPSRLDLSALLAQSLLAFTIEFDRDAELSLAISANALRVLSDSGVRLRDLPGLTGLSKEAIGMSMSLLERRGHVVIEPDPTVGRGRVVRFTAKGLRAQSAYRQVLDAVEERWHTRMGERELHSLRDSLQRLLEHPGLCEGLLPHPGGWRARKPYVTQTTAVARDPRAALPHHPMVLHRGGWPDGS